MLDHQCCIVLRVVFEQKWVRYCEMMGRTTIQPMCGAELTARMKTKGFKKTEDMSHVRVEIAGASVGQNK